MESITTMDELKHVVEQFIKIKFDEALANGIGKLGIKVSNFDTLDKLIYYTVYETIDVSKINYDMLGIVSIYIRVRREMLSFVENIYQLNGDERELGIVEEHLTGYYIQSYLMTKIN